MNILVTGGLGFVGSHLVHELLSDADNNVHVVDNLSNTIFETNEIIEAITAGRNGVLVCDIEDIESFEPQVSFDVIFHLASVVGPAAVLDCAGFIAQSIVRDTYKIISLAMACDARLAFISTSEVYGGGDEGFCAEQTPRIYRDKASARQEYAAAKMACEIAIANLCDLDKLNAVTIRPFNVAGVRQQGRAGFVVPRFVGQAMLGLKLTVFGDGSQLRAFTDARDVAQGILLACERGQTGEVYNVGNPSNRISIGELADCVLRITGAESGKVEVDPRTIYGDLYANAADKFPDASKLMSLGWLPKYSVDDTVEDVYRSFDGLTNERIAQLAGLSTTAFASRFR
jgi:nucleoside-diphosphate-sugar epimerase